MPLRPRPAAQYGTSDGARCHACGSEMESSDGFCAACGTPSFKVSCPNCQRPSEKTSAFCVHCGHRLRFPLGVTTDLPPSTAVQPPSERKYLTILCVDLQRSTELTASMEPEEAVSRLEPALAAMRMAVRRHGGIVSKELGDGLIALFGAPTSDANHAVMACNAALELIRHISQLEDPEIQVRVGLHSGYVIVRVISGDYSSVYEAGGPAMALANRLETAADAGQILASESCQRLAEGLVSFENSGPRTLKGFSYPVPTYKVTGRTGLSRWRARSARSLARLVGRSSELLALERAAEDTVNSAGQIVSIVGDPGIGKSRIAHEFLDQLAKIDWQVIEAECSPTSQAAPYATLKSLLFSLDRSFENPRFRINDYLGDLSSAFPKLWIQAIDAVLDRPVTDAQWNELEPRLRGRAIIDGFRALIGSVVGERRTVLLIEDLHWVDSASGAVIEALGSLTARHKLLILLTSRPDAAPEWLFRRSAACLWLRPLEPAAANSFLDILLGDSADLGDLKSRILRHTGRVPLFIEEVTRRLFDTGTVIGDWGHFILNKPSEELGVPPTVQGVIAGRIDRLFSREKSILQAASVIGPRTETTLLRAVAGVPEGALQSSLASLETAGLLIEVTLVPQQIYEFPHDLIREVAYDSIPGQHREQLHGQILRATELAALDHKEGAAEILSYHAVKARAWPEASSYAHLAARKCLARSALYDAAQYFEIAMDAVDRLDASVEREQRAIDLRIETRLVLPAIGSLRRWIDLSAEAEERSAAIGDSTRRVAALVGRAAGLNFHSIPLEAIQTNELAAREAEQLNAPGWLSMAEYGLGQAYLAAGRYRDAERTFGRANARLTQPDIEIPIGTTKSRLSVLCSMMKSVVHIAKGEPDEAETCQRRANEIAAETKHPHDIIAAGFGRGGFQLVWGSFEEAFSALNEALALARQHGVKQFLPVIACHLGNLYLQQDRTTEARDVLVEAKKEAEAVGHILSILRASIFLALTLCRLDAASGAVQLVRSARDQAAQQGFQGIRTEALVAEATVLASACPLDTVTPKKCLQAAMSIATRIEARPQLAAARALFGSIVARQGDVSLGVHELQEALDLFAAMKMTRQRERARELLAEALHDPTTTKGS
jgi:class 3 adenylate cyclase/tetratricopeptide (TPR) repeat protein